MTPAKSRMPGFRGGFCGDQRGVGSGFAILSSCPTDPTDSIGKSAMSTGKSFQRALGIAGSVPRSGALLAAIFVAGAMLIGPTTADAQQPGRGTYSPTPRSSGNKAARIGGQPGRSSASRQAGAGQIGARGAQRPQIGSLAPSRPQIGGGGAGASSRLPSRIQLPPQPGQGNFIQPQK